MNISGEALIGGRAVRGAGAPFHATDPARQAALEPAFHGSATAQVALACELAHDAFDTLRATSDEQRAALLDAIGAAIVALGATLIERAMAETGLPRARLEGERARTVGQLALFAALLRDGAWRDVHIDRALPERQPPRPDLRRQMVAVGPVAVFGASNFPLAFSVAGGDTAAALAAGCPVVVKGHPAHPGTSELVARAVVQAVASCKLPAGTFALLPGDSHEVGLALVRHPAIQAVGFTGSRQGGVALMHEAARRAQPIPVFAEMSSINPVFLLPLALAARAEQIGAEFAASLTLGVGQFCTNPGLVLGLEGPALDRFCSSAAQALSGTAAGTMLTPGIALSYQRGALALARHAGVEILAKVDAQAGQGGAALFRCDGGAFLSQPGLSAEVFGPAALVVACRDLAQLRQIASHLEGQLTATLHLADEDGDVELAQQLMPVLERKVGRILANGFPTGVEVAAAMVHGGPFPATSDGRSSSVGTAAIARFLRPVCYQNLPPALLPPALRDRQPA